MSNDVRGVLHGAAAVPSTDADVAGAWRRGRQLRVRRLAAGGLAIVAVVALGSIAVVNALPGGHDASPAGPVPTTIAATCAAPSTTPALPAWTRSANPPPDVPHLVSADGNVAAVVFGSPLRAGSPTDRQNKILWIMRLPRDGKRLSITATLPGSNAKPVRASFPADSGPGQIYPSGVDVPVRGCWHFALAWNGHHSAINLRYVAAAPSTTNPTVSPTTLTPPTVAPTTTPVTTATTTCLTANLTVTLGPPNGTAGHENYELAFRNDGPSPCTMTGYPGVSFVDGSGNQIGDPAARNPMSFTPVTLPSGATAYAHLAVTDPSVLSGCPATTAAKIRIYPPNETAAVLIGAGGIAVCATQPSSAIDPVLDHSLG